MSNHMSNFALICQGARMLGEVLQELSEPADDQSWVQLDRTIQAMITASLDEDEPDSDSIAFLYRCVSIVLPSQWMDEENTKPLKAHSSPFTPLTSHPTPSAPNPVLAPNTQPASSTP